MKSSNSYWLTVGLLGALASPTFGGPGSATRSKQPGGQTSSSVRLTQPGGQPKAKDAVLYHTTGVEQYKLGQYKEALDTFREAVRLAPKYAESYYYLGMAYSRLGRYREAVTAFRSVVDLDPKDAAAHAHLGALFGYFGQYAEAIEALKQSVLLQPNDADAQNNLGIAYGELGRYKEALEAFKVAIRVEPNNSLAYNNLGLAYHRMDRSQEALEPFKQALLLSADDNLIYSNLGLAHSALGQYPEAVEALRRAVQLDPQDAETYSNRSWVHLYMASGDQAALDAQSYLRLKGWRDSQSQYMAIVTYFGYRQARRTIEAGKILNEVAAKCDKAVWPYPMIRYLRRELAAPSLLALAGYSNKLAEARAYIGINLALSNRRGEALVHLRWVKQNGDQKFVEQRLAAAELRRLEAVVTASTGAIRPN